MIIAIEAYKINKIKKTKNSIFSPLSLSHSSLAYSIGTIIFYFYTNMPIVLLVFDLLIGNIFNINNFSLLLRFMEFREIFALSRALR